MPDKKLSINQIKNLALNATPGPWYRTEKPYGGPYGDEYPTMYGVGPVGERAGLEQHEDTICEVWGTEYDGAANGDFIAAMDPDTILSLCERIELLENKIKKLKQKT